MQEPLPEALPVSRAHDAHALVDVSVDDPLILLLTPPRQVDVLLEGASVHAHAQLGDRVEQDVRNEQHDALDALLLPFALAHVLQEIVALPNSRIMIHQPIGGAEGQAVDIRIQADEILRMKTQLNKILAKNTGQTVKKIEVDTDRDNFMTATEAKRYGIIDTILTARK